MSELNEEEESKKAPVVSDEDTSPNATPSLTPTEQADLTNRHSSPLPALLSVANDELTKGDWAVALDPTKAVVPDSNHFFSTACMRKH